MSAQWYVASEGQQLGPYTGEQLVQFGQEGRIVAETMVWAEGMAEWVPASQVEGLIPVPVAVAVAAKPVLATSNWAPPGATARPAALATAASASPYAAPRSGYGMAAPTADGTYPYFPVKSASFGLFLWTFLGMFVCFILFGVMVYSALVSRSDNSGPSPMMFGYVFLGLGVLCSMICGIYQYILLYRAWHCLQYGAPRSTPGKAIGFLFIPFFNFYWMFVAFGGLAKDWNRIAQSYSDLKTAPRLGETSFLLFPIFSIFLVFSVVSQMCKGINFFAYRRNPNTPSGSGLAGFGGIKFG